ncbi:unnamed protein product [Amoebophrya sp. A25]|nr:unnamed protein product [Amoebophrya sp. A25]|eukprot:GSA25T00024086001.1
MPAGNNVTGGLVLGRLEFVGGKTYAGGDIGAQVPYTHFVLGSCRVEEGRKKPDLERKIVAKIITGAKMMVIEIRERNWGRVANDAERYLLRIGAYRRSPEFAAEKQRWKFEKEKERAANREKETQRLRDQGVTDLIQLPPPPLPNRIEDLDAEKEAEKKWEKENGYAGIRNEYSTCKVLCWRFDQVASVTDSGNNNVQVLLSGSPLVLACHHDHAPSYSATDIAKGKPVSSLTSFPEVSATGCVGCCRELQMVFEFKKKKGFVEAPLFASRLGAEVNYWRWMEAEKACLKRERDDEREAVKIARQKIEKKEASIPKPVAKKSGDTLVTADEILKNTAWRATAPTWAVKSIERWKLSGGDSFVGSNADWQKYYTSRTQAEASEQKLSTKRENFLTSARIRLARTLVSSSFNVSTANAKKSSKKSAATIASSDDQQQLPPYKKITAAEAVRIANGLHFCSYNVEQVEDIEIRDVAARMRLFSSIAAPNVVDLDLNFHDRPRFSFTERHAFVQAKRSFGSNIMDRSVYDYGGGGGSGKNVILYDMEARDNDNGDYMGDKEKLCTPLKDSVELLETIVGTGRVSSARKAISSLVRAAGSESGKAPRMHFLIRELLHYKQKLKKDEVHSDNETVCEDIKSARAAFRPPQQVPPVVGASSSSSSSAAVRQAPSPQRVRYSDEDSYYDDEDDDSDYL